MKKILCIGHASYDVTFPCNGYPQENTKNRVNDKVECGGGPAANAAYLLGIWGMNTTFAGIVGNDHHGRRIKAKLESINVNTDYMEIDEDNDTTLSFIIVNKDNGSRTVFSYRSPTMRLKNKMDAKADVILMDGQELKVSIEAIENNPNAISILDAGTLKDETLELGKRVNYLVCSKNFAEDFTHEQIDFNNPEIIANIYYKLESTFKNNIIITIEDKGCIYKKDNMIRNMPSIKVPAVDTTGAGDFFHGAFAYCIANDFDIEKSIKISNIAGALTVTKMGSWNKVYPLEDVMKVYEETV